MPTGTNSFSQVTIIKNGKKYTKTTHNGKTVEEVSSTGKDGYLNKFFRYKFIINKFLVYLFYNIL